MLSTAPQPASEERRYASWSLICGDPLLSNCSLSQIVARDPQGKKVVLGATVHIDRVSMRPQLSLRQSPDALKEAGIGLKIEPGPEYRLPIAHCDTQVCEANGWLEGDLRRQLEHAKVAQVAFRMNNRQQVLAPLSLQGLDQGLQELMRRAVRSPNPR